MLVTPKRSDSIALLGTISNESRKLNYSDSDNKNDNDTILTINGQSMYPNDISFTFTYRITNNFIYRISNPVIAAKLIDIIFSKFIFIVFVIIWVTYALLGAGSLTNTSIFKFFAYFATLTLCVLVLLTTNIKVFISGIKTFEFWIKLLLTIRADILQFIVIYHYKIYENQTETGTNLSIRIITDITGFFNWLTLIILFCVIDGIQIGKKWKIFYACVVSCYVTYLAIHRTLEAPEPDITVIRFTSKLSISLFHSYVSSLRVLALFLWKQTITLIRKPGQCINIKKSPSMKWV